MAKNIFLAIIIAFISSFPLLGKGLPPTHDGEYHVIRFYEFNRTLLDGNIYPRWAPDLNNGFGIPLFNYVYPLPSYVASILHSFGSSFIDAVKLNMFLAVILGAVFMYLWTREYWGDLGGLVSSAFYSFSPYHLLDIYIRGSVGEVWALAFFPAFLWSIIKFSKNNKNLYLFLSAIFLSLIIFSHNILAFMFFFFAMSYWLFVLKNKLNYRYIVIFVLALLLSAIFWLPALLEKQFVRGLEVYDYSKNFPEFYQLIFPSWGSGFSGDTSGSGLSFQVGITNLLILLGCPFLLFKNKHRNIITFSISSFVIIFILMLQISLPFWKIFPFMNYFQFPWRFLSLEILIISLLAGGMSILLRPKIFSVLLIITTILLGIGYAKPAYYMLRNDDYYITRSNFIDGTNSPGNSFNTIWMGPINKQKDKIITNGTISNLNIKSTRYSFVNNSKVKNEITVNTAYFPGWNVYIDGKKTSTKISKNGFFTFDIEKGKHKVFIAFEDTPIRKVATFISLMSIFFVLLNLSRFVRIKR